MSRTWLWALAHSLLLGVVSTIESSGECVLATTTIFVPTTVYTLAPNITTGGGGNSCVATSSSSIPIGTSVSSSTQTTVIVTPTSTPPLSTSSPGPSTTASSTCLTSTSVTHTSWSNGSTTTGSSTPALPTSTSTGGLPPPPPPPPPGPFRGFKNTAYFTNWGISQEKYIPQRLPVEDLSHVLYAFADIAPNGTVLSANPAADVRQRYAGDGGRGGHGRDAYGAVKQLYLHKKRNRGLKVLLSVGGGEFSPKFAAATSTAARRATFAASAVRLVTDWGFDGVDIDWEYPTSEGERDNLVRLVAACRDAFDRYAARHRVHYHFLVTVASPAGPANWAFVDLPRMNQYVDIWHLMSYDYAGSWVPRSGHQANVFANRANAASTPLNTNDTVRYYESQGIDRRKIVMGLPLFGRSFNGTSGLGQNYTSIGTGGPQPGVWYYKDLPKPGAREEFDEVAKATYSYDRKARELITYDNVRSTTFKARYIRDNRLGGAFFWEASGDRAGHGSLIKTMSHTLDWLDRTPNNLRYPTSRYMNIRFGIPGA